ncbi:HpcH/HpaI aldolase/citrate lyase family protein [Rhizorhabdus dicambivorans]|uniref:CoA ester lyase n=1 Tax=Rhizorhabdus dicambivorans TaxID=1850238 RepID=A0A2A4FQW6_9SPHN|nr:CoA ester lyase [Rhizorhabdus dicambivorans]ATE64264.1 CoA ester lyase [Rhizorhabdus dicambivorans]PCE40557.1 CoA ester lyase [Rhizorhabdus dicambivorans]
MSDREPRIRRSALYLPASNERAIEKARTLPCDVVILDLEDAVAPEAKEAAREMAARAVADGGFGRRELVVRVNGLGTPWGEADLAAIGPAGADAILVPKIDDGATLRRYDALLAQAPAATRLWAMIETARSMFALQDIAAQAEATRLACFVMGTNDLAKELRASPDVGREGFVGFLSSTVAAARAHGLSAIDGVFNDIGDAEGLVRQCAQALALGFDGKTLIHPGQIDICNRAFTPGDDRIEAARAIVAAFDAPENAGAGALKVNGQMAERLHLEQARALLAMRAQIDEMG